jgi:hypothetical protein
MLVLLGRLCNLSGAAAIICYVDQAEIEFPLLAAVPSSEIYIRA